MVSVRFATYLRCHKAGTPGAPGGQPLRVAPCRTVDPEDVFTLCDVGVRAGWSVITHGTGGLCSRQGRGQSRILCDAGQSIS